MGQYPDQHTKIMSCVFRKWAHSNRIGTEFVEIISPNDRGVDSRRTADKMGCSEVIKLRIRKKLLQNLFPEENRRLTLQHKEKVQKEFVFEEVPEYYDLKASV